MNVDIRARVWLERDSKPILGEGRARLLEAVDRHGSLNKAANELGYSYRHAWGILKRMSEALGTPVIISKKGGKSGGRSELTPEGRELLGLFKEKMDAIAKALDK